MAKALDFVRQIRKTPIVVNDARFFYANRCIIPYINEGIRMVREGVAPALVENAAKLVGMPLGPLQLVDETSIDLGVKIAKATKAAMGDAYPDGEVDEVLFWMADQGRLGRKANAGFYAYDDKGKRGLLWDGLSAEAYPPRDDQPDLTDVQHRLLFAQVLEAVRAFEDGVLTDIREGDVGAILGWGFAPWSGGPFSWLDMLGAAKAAETCDELTARFWPALRLPEAAARAWRSRGRRSTAASATARRSPPDLGAPAAGAGPDRHAPPARLARRPPRSVALMGRRWSRHRPERRAAIGWGTVERRLFRSRRRPVMDAVPSWLVPSSGGAAPSMGRQSGFNVAQRSRATDREAITRARWSQGCAVAAAPRS